MYTRITRNTIDYNYKRDLNVFSFGYCEIQYIITALNLEASGYNNGVYGWNYTAYEVNTKYNHRMLLVTGYRPIKARRLNYKIVERYEKKVFKLLHSGSYKKAKEVAKRFLKLLDKGIEKQLSN